MALLLFRWFPGRATGVNNAQVTQDLIQRLDLFEAENITVVASAGAGLDLYRKPQTPCCF